MRTSSLLLLFSLMLTSCFDYEPEVSVLVYQNEDIAISDALQEDWGTHSGNHYNMDFTLIGSSTLFVENENFNGSTYYTLSEDIDCYLFIELFSSGKEGFKGGVFTALGDRRLSEAKGEHVFRTFQFGQSLDEGIIAERGSILLSEDQIGQTRISLDLTLSNGKKLKGHYIGLPIYFDRR